MIANHISGNIISQQYDDGKLNVPIAFDWFETDKKRMSKVAEDGTEFGVMVGQTIKDGDVLAETDDKRYFARIKTAQLIEIPVDSMKEMGRLCFELGNRHLSLKVENDRVLVPYDHPTMEYTKKIGYEPHIVEGGFDGFLIVKAHAGTGTIIPGTNKTTGDVAEEEQEAAADAAFPAEEQAGHLDVHAHEAGGHHCHCHGEGEGDGGHAEDGHHCHCHDHGGDHAEAKGEHHCHCHDHAAKAEGETGTEAEQPHEHHCHCGHGGDHAETEGGHHCHCHDHDAEPHEHEHEHEHEHHHHVVDETVDADHPYQLKPGEYEMNGVLHRPDGSHSHDGGRTWHVH